MKTLRNEFPHPVLIDSGSDYVNCSFELSVPENIKIEDGHLSFDIGYSVISNGLNELLKNGNVQILIKIQSPKTAYRNTFVFDDLARCHVKIPQYSVAEKIEIYGSIIARQSIKQFCLPEHNKDLFGTTYFEIRKADILAMAKKIVIPLDASELEGPVASIFLIHKNLALKTTMQVNFDDENGKINIHLNEKSYDTYSLLRTKSHGLKRYLEAVIVFPALIEALSLIKTQSGEESEYAEKRWYKMIIKKSGEKNINLEETGITESANTLLDNVVEEALVSLYEKMNTEFDEEFESGGTD